MSTVAGRDEVTARALVSCARAAVAEVFGVGRREVHVRLGDDRGDLALDIATPVRLGDGLTDTAHAGLVSVRDRVAELTGRRVGTTTIELTGVVANPARRVR